MISWREFGLLILPPTPELGDGEIFSSSPISEDSMHRIGRDHRGHVCILLNGENASATRPTEIPYENLNVRLDLECEILSPVQHRNPGRVTYSVIRCTAENTDLQKLFFSLVPMTIEAVGATASRERILATIERLSEMFSALLRPARRSVQGLWGELLVMVLAHDPERLIRCWHATAFDTFDFNEGAERIEVKTVASHARSHIFSLDQLVSPEGTRAIIASLIVKPAGAGSSVANLYDELSVILSNEPRLKTKIDLMIVESLGNQWARRADFRFDRQAATDSLRFYAAENIPQVPVLSIPDGVSRVSFVSDLSRIEPISEFPEGSLFAAGQPRRRRSTKALPDEP